MDELKRLHGWASRNAVEVRLKVNSAGELILRAADYSVNLTQAISELVDERIEKAFQYREAIEKERARITAEAARGGHE